MYPDVKGLVNSDVLFESQQHNFSCSSVLALGPYDDPGGTGDQRM